MAHIIVVTLFLSKHPHEFVKLTVLIKNSCLVYLLIIIIINNNNSLLIRIAAKDLLFLVQWTLSKFWRCSIYLSQ